MNIKKSPLMAGLLTLNAIFGAMTGKSEEQKSYTDRVFGQERVATVSVGDVTVSLAQGLKETGLKEFVLYNEDGSVKTNVTKVVENGTFVSNIVSVATEWREVVQTRPFIVENGTSGFAKPYDNFPELSDIAANADKGTVYASIKTDSPTNVIYQMDIKGTGNLLTAAASLRPIYLRNSNSEDAGMSYATADKMISWTSINQENGSVVTNNWLSMFNSSENLEKLYHINGVVNYRRKLDNIIPTEYCETTDKVYMTDGNTTREINKAEPTAARKDVNTPAGTKVGLGVVNGDLYQATASGIYIGTQKQVVQEPIVNPANGRIRYETTTMPSIQHMVSDGKRLIVAYNADANVSVDSLVLNETTPVLAISGATKVIASKNAVHALVQGKLVRVRE